MHLTLTLPVICFGGPYSNLEATQALLDEARARGIPTERMVCTGDVVAYGADARTTVDLLRDACIHVVMGNCEESLGSRAGNCGCGFAPGSACDELSAAWYSHADRELGADERRWMASLPRRLDVELAGTGFTLAVIHGSLMEINRFVFASTPERVKATDLALCGADGIVAGHCGLPFTQVIEGRLWHNPGVLGMPANDGTPRVWFSVISQGAKPHSLAIEHVDLGYDHARAGKKMTAAGLPEGYVKALSTGRWPSCDVLPSTEVKATGRPLRANTLTWQYGRPLVQEGRNCSFGGMADQRQDGECAATEP
jgi:predicted phosphodiesterase